MMVPAFIHFMAVDSPIFNGVLIQLINETMKAEEHMFLVGGKDAYIRLSKQYKNVVYEPNFQLSTIQKYDTGREILIVHSMFLTSTELCCLETKQLKRLVWCVWGHDLYQKRESRTLKMWVRNWRADRKIGDIRAIVAGFKYDINEIRHRFGKSVPVYNAFYASGYYKDDVDCIVRNYQRTDARTHIMVGHSAYSFLQHKKIFRQLEKYKNEDMVITLMLSYGDKEYATKIVEDASKMFGVEKLNVIHNFMTWHEYIQLLCNIDIAIFDFDHQAAFGNLILLSYLGKKIYLSPTGVMYRAFKTENSEVYSCLDIGRITFEELRTKKQLNANTNYAESLLNKENIITQWKNLFQTIG